MTITAISIALIGWAVATVFLLAAEGWENLQ